MNSDHYGEAASYLAAELSTEWQRKGALESRALSLITANVAIVALFFGIATRSILDLPVSKGSASGYTLAGLITMAVSTLFALSSVVPANYAAPSNQVLATFVDRALSKSADSRDIYEDTLRSRLGQIVIARKWNTVKAILCFLAITALAAGTALFATALLRASR